ncbi:SPW repeat protein [Flavobacterium sp. DG2-3]|uniref:SPW repeat protein n=1 Tax=Flavobacterium sp. DG2-3 TaxID=3068317 RepID=UPI00273F8DFE|nr:SPW repeat protein [Flavobacterium sp. DG2-3]MDP5200325.1 SPW repeat protein [Flavobacterium sp. DG2-3]
MKFLETKLHGYLDYSIGLLLLFMPSLFRLEAHTAQSLIFYIFGIFTIFLSLQTDYEAGIYKLLPMEAHIVIEILSGLFFALSPWIFGFAGKVFLPHLLFGSIAVFLALATKTQNSIFQRLF